MKRFKTPAPKKIPYGAVSWDKIFQAMGFLAWDNVYLALSENGQDVICYETVSDMCTIFKGAGLDDDGVSFAQALSDMDTLMAFEKKNGITEVHDASLEDVLIAIGEIAG